MPNIIKFSANNNNNINRNDFENGRLSKFISLRSIPGSLFILITRDKHSCFANLVIIREGLMHSGGKPLNSSFESYSSTLMFDTSMVLQHPFIFKSFIAKVANKFKLLIGRNCTA